MISSSPSSDVLTIHAFIRQWAERIPEATAVISPDGDVLTYSQLNALVQQTHWQLRELGIHQSDRVALLFPPGVLATTTFLSVASCAVTAPLNYRYQRRELEASLSVVKPSLLIVDSNLDSVGRDIARENGIAVIELEPTSSGGLFTLASDQINSDSERPKSDSSTLAAPEDTALIVYTSGSTGHPKCVPLSHGVICEGSRRTAESLGLTQRDRCLNLIAPCSVHGLVSNTTMPIVAGASILATPGFDSDCLPRWILEGQPTWISAPPALQQQIAETMLKAGSGSLPKTSLRFLRSGAVPIWPELIALLNDTFGVPLVEAYGMSEVPHISGNPWQQCRSGSVGKPLVDELAVWNSDGEILPPGNVGEIVVRGRNVTSGYLDNPEANARAFSDGWLRTGDLGWLDEDGYLFLTGRSQEVINRGGNKVMPREVEEVLMRHSSVRHAVVFPVSHPVLGTDVAAAVVLATGNTLNESTLRRFARAQISDFKVPTRIIQLDEIPVEASGKVNRLGLEDLLSDALTVEFEPPIGSIDAKLARIFQQVLQISQVGCADNFFSLGGHSLLAGQVTARVEMTFGLNLPLRSLFDFPTVRELSAEITRLQSEEAEPQRQPLNPLNRTRNTRLPLSFSQQRMWFLEQMHGESTAYNLLSVWKLHGQLNVEALRNAFEAIVHRHEPLRTSFAVEDGSPVPVTAPPAPFSLAIEDLRTLDPENIDATIDRLCREEAERRFDLSTDLMLRASLLQLTDDEHLLLLTVHHIAFDGWSMRVLWSELTIHYEAYCRGVAPSLSALPIRYVDYANWQREQLHELRQTELYEHWRKQLEGITPLGLPTDRPRPSEPSYLAAHHSFELPLDLTQRIRTLAQSEGVTSYMTLLAAFQLLLARYSGKEDIAVATPIAGRNHEHLENLIGFFANTLVLRTDLSNAPTFRDLLRQVREVTLAAFDHQELPFEKLVEKLQPKRDISRNPLVQVLFQLMDFPDEYPAIAGVEVTRLPQRSERVIFDLELHLVERSGMVSGTIVFSTDLFERPTIDRMAERFVSLLTAIAHTPGESIHTLPLMTESERHQVLIEWNKSSVAYPSERLLHELFEEQVTTTPDRTALVFENQQLTYRKLDDRANKIAALLHERLETLRSNSDLTPFVGLCLDRGPDMVAGILAILKAGAAWIPIDPEYPDSRISGTLNQSETEIVLTQGRLADRIPHGVELINVDQFSRANTEDSSSVQRQKLSDTGNSTPEKTAYVIFTSGSTGKPKGVDVPHQAIVNLLCDMRSRLGLSSEDRFLGVASPTFDISIAEVFLPLICGGAAILVSPDDARSSDGLTEIIRNQRPTFIQATPATWQMLCEFGWNGTDATLISTGEALPRPLGEKLLKQGNRLWNLYGPTETTIWSTGQLVETQADLGSIGRPIANTQVYVLDEEFRPVPPGIFGELYIGGAGLARGYLGRPDLTRERFITSPFDPSRRTRLYRTGDEVRWRSDGTLECRGRFDNQVKLRGYRIELGEIESVLHQHPSVSQCAVLLRTDQPGDPRLVAYVTGSAGSFREFRQHLQDRVPPYMVPSIFESIEEFPLTISGKIDRKALPEPAGQFLNTTERATFVLPCTESETQIASIWGELLGLKAVDIHSSFFDLGGHSLLAARLVDRIDRKFPGQLKLADVFRRPTIAEQAELLAIGKQARFPGNSNMDGHHFLSTLKDGTVENTVICIGGSVTVLVDHMPESVTVLGIGIDGVQSQPFQKLTIPELAQAYANEIIASCPSGRVIIAGFCYGGLLAWATAQHLRAHFSLDFELFLLEPTTKTDADPVIDQASTSAESPSADASKTTPLLSKARHYIKHRINRARIRFRMMTGQHVTVEDRWNLYAAHIMRNARTFAPSGLIDGPVTLVAGAHWLERHRKFWLENCFRQHPIIHNLGDVRHTELINGAASQRAWVKLMLSRIEQASDGLEKAAS